MDEGLGALVQRFEAVVRAERSPQTARIYKWHLKWYLDWLKRDPSSVDNPERSVGEYLWEKGKAWDRGTVSVALHALSKFWTKVMYRPFNKDMITLTGQTKGFVPVILTREEVAALFRAAERELGTTEYLMMQTGWHCALRRSELTALTTDSLLPNYVIQCPIAKSRRPRFKNIAVPVALYESLKALTPSARGKLFINKSTGRPYRPNDWSWVFGKFARRVLGKDVRWHDFARHTRLTHYAEETKNFYQVLMLSGHSNPAVAKRYFEWARVELPELDKLPEWWPGR
jgi:integrase